MRRGARTVSVLILCAVIIVAFYMYLNKAAGDRKEKAKTETITEMDRLLDADFDKYYPPTPRAVIKYYNRYSMVCFGEEKPSESDTKKLAKKMRELMDDDLAAANSESSYAASLWSEVKDFTDRKATLIEADVDDTDDVVYKTIKDKNYAYVQTMYLIREAGTYTTTYQKFVLRQDDKENWKIYGFTRTDKDGNPIDTTTKTK